MKKGTKEHYHLGSLSITPPRQIKPAKPDEGEKQKDGVHQLNCLSLL